MGEDGQPQPLIVVLPAADAEILDTWYTAGMHSTGSHDISVKDAFIPAKRAFPFANFVAGPSRPTAGYKRPFFELAPGLLASVALGIAKALSKR